MGWHDPWLWGTLLESGRRARRQFTDGPARASDPADETVHGRRRPVGEALASRREVARIAVPVSLEAVFQMLFGLVDQVIVGTLGAVAIAAVGLTNGVTFIAILAYASLGAGSAILVSQAYGRHDRAGVAQLTAVALVLATAVAVLTSVPLVLFAAEFLRLVGAGAAVVGEGAVYLRVVALTLPLVVTGAVTSAVLRALGDARTPMVVTLAAVGLNTVLGVLLVFGAGPAPALGLLGAALATLAAQTARGVALTLLLYRRPEIGWAWPRGGGDLRSVAGRLMALTYPITLGELLWGLGTFLYTLLFTRLGTQALAASQIVIAVEAVFIVASSGLAAASVTLVGQALGAGRVREARRKADALLRLGVVTSVLFGCLLVGAGLLLEALYPSVAPQVLRTAFWGVVLNALFQPAKVLNMVLGGGVLSSGGDTRFVLLGDAASTYAVGLPLALLLGFGLGFGVWGVFAARVLEEVVKVAVFLARYRTPGWYAAARAAEVNPASAA